MRSAVLIIAFCAIGVFAASDSTGTVGKEVAQVTEQAAPQKKALEKSLRVPTPNRRTNWSKIKDLFM